MCLLPPPMRHLFDRNATPTPTNATPLLKEKCYICTMKEIFVSMAQACI